MTRPIENEYNPDVVSPPGDTLLEILEAIGMTQAELAERMGRPNKTICEIIKGKTAITPETALQLERVLGTPAVFWSNREERYAAHVARVREQERLEGSIEWLKQIPVSEMARLGWIKAVDDCVEQLRVVLDFFGVASPESWNSLWTAPQAAFRQSAAFEADPGAVAAWLRKGEIEAQKMHGEPFDPKKVNDILPALRSLTRRGPDTFVPEIKDVCSGAGVAVVFVPELPKSRVSGATRWLSPGKALVQLSLRYRTDDHLWFTFFHEIGHILLHGKRHAFLEGESADSEMEREANRFAADALVAPKEYRRLVSGRLSEARVRLFADDIGVAPGIVVGRLQHDGLLPFTHLNRLKKHFTWHDN